ncbi:MAG: 2OG-Fe(II) oxygenase [Rhodospirillaceae bacterium]
MADHDPAFNMLDEAAIAAAVLNRKPYDYAYVDQAIPLKYKDEVLADCPVIPDRGSYSVPHLKSGPKFKAILQDLATPRFQRLIENKFDIDLTSRPQVMLMMGNTSGAYNEGYAHPDSKHKIITVLVGFSREWPYERGKLRILNSSDREDVAFEYAPEFGRMLMFRVSDRSWHGFLPQKGQRMSLQLCWVDTEWYVKYEYWRHSFSALLKSVPMLGTAVKMLPRRSKYTSPPVAPLE